MRTFFKNFWPTIYPATASTTVSIELKICHRPDRSKDSWYVIQILNSIFPNRVFPNETLESILNRWSDGESVVGVKNFGELKFDAPLKTYCISDGNLPCLLSWDGNLTQSIAIAAHVLWPILLKWPKISLWWWKKRIQSRKKYVNAQKVVDI